MADVVWLASYPKSGNTWLRFLIANLLAGDLPDSRALQVAIPDAHRVEDLGAGRGTRLVKTHWLFEHLPPRHTTRGFIYIVRNPFDVIASNFRFAMLGADPAALNRPAAEVARLRADYVDRFLEHRGDPRWIGLGFGTWDQHVASWRAAADRLPSLRLRYEDLLADAFPAVERIARFLGIERDPAALRTAIERSSFATMRALEEREIRDRRPGLFWGDQRDPARAAGHRFIAKAGRDLGRDEFDPAVRERIAQTFARELRALGYADATAPMSAAETVPA